MLILFYLQEEATLAKLRLEESAKLAAHEAEKLEWAKAKAAVLSDDGSGALSPEEEEEERRRAAEAASARVEAVSRGDFGATGGLDLAPEVQIFLSSTFVDYSAERNYMQVRGRPPWMIRSGPVGESDPGP